MPSIETLQNEIERRLLKRKPQCHRAAHAHIMEAMVRDPRGSNREYDGAADATRFKLSVLRRPDVLLTTGGSIMEQTAEAVSIAREELTESKKELERTVNEMQKLRETVQDMLAKEIQNIRESRQAIARESADTLTALRDIRKFFMDGDYREEMARLERFISMARELKALLNDGTIGAAADVMLKLADGGRP